MSRSLESQSEGPTLVDEMKDMYAKRDFTVRPETINIVGVLLFWYTTLLYPIILAFSTLPTLADTWSEYWWGLGFGLFVAVQLVMNWKRCANVHMDVVHCQSCKAQGKERPIPPPPTNGQYEICKMWKFCAQCQCDIPPRAHHCRLCKVCILKRDHHCFFTGRCIGFHNQRHFIVLSFYTVVAGFYFAAWFYAYMSISTPFWPMSWDSLNYLIPVSLVNFFISDVTLGFLINLFNAYLAVAIAILGFLFLIWEVAILYTGQTTWEAGHLVRRYQMSFMSQWRSVFGSWGLIQFLWPFQTAQLGDGFNWPLAKGGKGY